MDCGIYLIINTVNGKVYVGSAVSIRRRIIQHRCDLNKAHHTNGYLLKAWQRHGADAFQFVTIQLCRPEERIAVEQRWIERLDALNSDKGYNLITAQPGGAAPGRKHSAETKAKLAAAARAQEARTGMLASLAALNRGRKLTEEQRAKLRGRVSSWKGKTPSAETRQKMSLAKKGKPSWNKGISPSAETREKLAAANRGKIASAETRAKLSASNLGRAGYWLGKTMSPETKAKMSAAQTGRPAANKGIPHSAAHRAKISAAGKGRLVSEETKAKISAAKLAAFAAGREAIGD